MFIKNALKIYILYLIINMPKLYFRYGTMNAAKTANLLMVNYKYTSQNKKTLLIKPYVDTRFGHNIIKSRALTTEINADITLKHDDDLSYLKPDDISCILVDECQFLSTKNIDDLRALTQYCPVICYGLKTDFKSHLFEGSKRLLEIADTIEEIKSICSKCCTNKSTINAKFVNNKIIKTGTEIIDIGAEDKYISLCWNCWI
jgi:thymidine kinase